MELFRNRTVCSCHAARPEAFQHRKGRTTLSDSDASHQPEAEDTVCKDRPEARTNKNIQKLGFVPGSASR